jgi:hypothetical protein
MESPRDLDLTGISWNPDIEYVESFSQVVFLFYTTADKSAIIKSFDKNGGVFCSEDLYSPSGDSLCRTGIIFKLKWFVSLCIGSFPLIHIYYSRGMMSDLLDRIGGRGNFSNWKKNWLIEKLNAWIWVKISVIYRLFPSSKKFFARSLLKNWNIYSDI